MIDKKITAIVDGEFVDIAVDDAQKVSDGYHTFEELYDHRITLYIACCRRVLLSPTIYEDGVPRDIPVWRSKLHSDGTMFPGQFILGIGERPGEQITYHLPLDRWDETDFAETLERGPEFDGHTSADVLERLKKL